MTFFHTFSTEPQVVSTSVQPSATKRLERSIVTPNAGRMTTSSACTRVERFARFAQEADALRAQLVVDVRVVDDLAGQVDAAIGEARARLVGVVHGAVHAVAEAELARQVDGEPAGLVAEAVVLDARDEVAVVALGEHAATSCLQIEALAEDQGALRILADVRDRAASARRAAAAPREPALPNASSTWP